MTPRRLLLAAALLLGAAAPSAHASAADMTFKVEVTGIHDVMWSYKSDTYNQRCKGWSEGAGTQVTGLSVARPMTFKGLRIGRQFTLLGPMKPPRYRATVERKSDWQDHAIPITADCTGCGPLSEYGPCQGEAPPLVALQRCGRKTIDRPGIALSYVPAGTADRDDDAVVSLTDALEVTLTAPTAGLFPACGPRSGGGVKQPDPLKLAVAGARARKLTTLRVGRKLTLKASEQQGHIAQVQPPAEPTRCSPKTLVGLGYRECATTEATIEVTRTR